MSRTLTSILAILLGLAPVQAQRSAAVDALLMQGLHAALLHEYGHAREAFASAAQADPEDPAAFVLMAGLLHQSAEDLSVPFDRRAFDSLLTHAEVLANGASDGGRSDRHLWRSTGRGMLSVIESQAGQWMSAIRDALASASDARSTLERDAGLADGGLPMGNYLYWRSRKTEALQWLPFIADDRAEGIRLLEWCAVYGRYHRWAALSSLIWVLHDAGALDRAESWARKGLETYPTNRTFLAGFAKVLESRGAHREAADAWASIAHALRHDPASGRYAIFSASVNHLRCATSAGDLATAHRLLREIAPPTAKDVPDWLVSRWETKMKEWEALRTALAAEPVASSGAKGVR